MPPSLTSIGVAWRWLRWLWNLFSNRNQRWVLNVAIGLFIEAIIIGAHNSSLGVFARNWALDAAMQGYAGLNPRGGPTLPLVFIDIDEETWRSKWWGGGKPLRAPRDQLLMLIDYALDHDARYVAVDVFVDSADDDPFAGAIAERAKKLEEAPAHQHILFARTVMDPLYEIREFAPELLTSPLDATIQGHSKWLHAVAPYFQVSRDGVLRDWRMWRVGCRQDAEAGPGHWEILPSVQLLISTLVLPQKSDQREPWGVRTENSTCAVDLTSFARGSGGASENILDRGVKEWLEQRPELTGGSLFTVPAATSGLTSRIFFKFRYPPEPSQVWLIPGLKLLDPKSEFLDPKSQRSVDFAGGLVVIGQSFAAARDQHSTPLGPMPGAMVLINSVASMLDLKLLRPPAGMFEYPFAIGSIILIGFVFSRFESFVAIVVIMFTFVPLLIATNYVLLRLGGIWLDFAAPLMAIWAHRQISLLLPRITRRIRRRHERHDV
jgi:CHASE2 domain-containing sensor protein